MLEYFSCYQTKISFQVDGNAKLIIMSRSVDKSGPVMIFIDLVSIIFPGYKELHMHHNGFNDDLKIAY